MKKYITIIVVTLFVAFSYIIFKSRLVASISVHPGEWPPEVIEKVIHDRIEREKLRLKYPKLFAAVSKAMFKHDIIGINLFTNTNEYEPETGTIIPKLKKCTSAVDISTMLHKEYMKWFGADIAGKRENYVKLGNEIWALWVDMGPNKPFKLKH